MTVTELLAKFANPEIMESLAISDKIKAGLITTVLGMGITFTALVVLLFIISWMNKILNPKKSDPITAPTAEVVAETGAAVADTAPQQDDRELVAAITTAIAMTLKTSTSNIVIKNIEKIEDNSPAWNRAGIVEQMNSRF